MSKYLMDHNGVIHRAEGARQHFRPVVVLDTEFFATVVKHLRIAAENDSALTTLWWLAEQIEAQTKPLKPDEPQGLGAVVEDAAGRRWVRWTLGEWPDRAPWRVDSASVDHRKYDRIAVVKVLSEGVTA